MKLQERDRTVQTPLGHALACGILATYKALGLLAAPAIRHYLKRRREQGREDRGGLRNSGR